MRYRFADCILDVRNAPLWRGGQPIQLPPRLWEMLHYLVKHHDRVVSYKELSAHVWPAEQVKQATLERYLQSIRLSLGDTGNEQRIMQTRRGYGYQCATQVQQETLCTCPVCQEDTPEQAASCAVCGAQLQQGCPRCHHTHPLTAQFCTRCGQPLSATAPWHIALPLLYKTEDCCGTVLCCTLAPTSQTGKGDPEGMYCLQQALWTLARAVIPPYGGRLHAVLDTHLCALFVSHRSRGDDAPRAVQAALALRQRVQQQSAAWSACIEGPISLRMGLHTGRVVIQRRQDGVNAHGTVLGEGVSIAMMLQAHAAPGMILCSDATAGHVHRLVHLDALEPVQGAGLPAPEMIYAVRACVEPAA